MLALLVFWVLVIWGLYDGDVDSREAWIYGSIWLVFAVLPFLWRPLLFPAIIVEVILDVIMILKVLGRDVIAW
jgi:hypothetical protein